MMCEYFDLDYTSTNDQILCVDLLRKSHGAALTQDLRTQRLMTWPTLQIYLRPDSQLVINHHNFTHTMVLWSIYPVCNHPTCLTFYNLCVVY